MSEKENNRMEAWLKAYRQQRLDQWNEDPVELDEPTRAMLMAEVRRQKTVAPVEATTASEPTLNWLRWVLGGMTAAIVVLGVTYLSYFNLNFKSDPDTMARAENTVPQVEGGTAIGMADAPAEQSNRDVAEAVPEGSEGAGVGGFAPSVSGTVHPVPSQVAPTHAAPSVP